MTETEKKQLDPKTTGLFVEQKQTLYLIGESKLQKTSYTGFDSLRKILLARGYIRLDKLGNLSGESNKEHIVSKYIPRLMSVKDAIENNYEIEIVYLNTVDENRSKKDKTTSGSGFFKK